MIEEALSCCLIFHSGQMTARYPVEAREYSTANIETVLNFHNYCQSHKNLLKCLAVFKKFFYEY